MDTPSCDCDRLAGLCAAALNALDRPVAICNRTNVVFVNDTVARILGAESTSELIGIAVNEVIHPDMYEASSMRREALVESRQELFGVPVKLMARDGSPVCTVADVLPVILSDGTVLLVYTLGRSVSSASGPPKGSTNLPTTRKSPFEAALEVLPEVAMIHDADLMLFTNAACREFLAAQSAEDLEGQPIDTIVHPDASAAGRERRRLALESRQPFRRVALKVVARDGHPKHVTADALPITADGVNAVLVVARA
jgi:PAS domain S-box-containing protein